MASGHVSRIERPDTWLPPTDAAANVRETLDSWEPSTHGNPPEAGDFTSRRQSDPKARIAA